MADNIIARTGAEALIRDQLINTIQQDVPKSSIVMQLATRLANMTSNQTKIPVLSMLPLAYWVNGDTGMKQTSKQEWKNVTMTAAELAVIVPIPEAVLADSSFDIMGEVQPRVREAMAAKVDSAILFGNDKPTEWTNYQQSDSITAARLVQESQAAAAANQQSTTRVQSGTGSAASQQLSASWRGSSTTILNLDSREVARSTAPYMDEELAFRS